MKKTVLFILLAFSLILFLSGCAHSPNVQQCVPEGTHIYGFWGGTWHGIIMWLSFIGSLFNDDIVVYAVNNNGAWYNFGFVGGFGVMLKIIGEIIKGIFSE